MSVDIGPPTRGARPRYLDRPLTSSERAKLYRARKAGKDVPPALILDPLQEMRVAFRAWKESDQKGEIPPSLLTVFEKYLGEKH